MPGAWPQPISPMPQAMGTRRVTKPPHFLARMGVFILAMLAIAYSLMPVLEPAFRANLVLNSIIAATLVIGILSIFRQVAMLAPEVAWIERNRQAERPSLSGKLPQLLSPLANVLGERSGRRVSLSPVSMRTLLDGIAARLDEQRETSRYLIGVLVFLGLLGTFFGLLVTVRSVSGVLSALSVGNGDVATAMTQLKSSLGAPLEGMSEAFSSSLFGLAGSLVLGFLDLQAGQAQNRFFNELEEWLSGLTRVSAGGGEAGEQPVPAFIQALLEQTADSLDSLQRTMLRGEEGRVAANESLRNLSDRLSTMTEQMRTEQSVLLHLAEGQKELRAVLARFAEATRTGGSMDDVTREHIRSIDGHLSRLATDLVHGREDLVRDLRGEIRLVARTIAAAKPDQGPAEDGTR